MLKGFTEGSRAMLKSLVRAMDTGRIRPVIDKVFDFAEAPEAFAHLHSGTHFGKVMIRL
jgi:NADPH:quinone reductase-like Zn-dependent oxidoreductase